MITRARGFEILLHGVVMATVMLVLLVWQGDDASLPAARMLAFCVAAFSQLLLAVGLSLVQVTIVELAKLILAVVSGARSGTPTGRSARSGS